MPRYVLGVDGGTTKTIALVADDQGRILGAGRGGNSNWTGPDVERPMSVVVGAARQALDQAELTGDDVEMGVFGLAGADWPEDYVRRQACLEQGDIARRVIVRNDGLVGWRSGTRERFGVVVTAGTGTNTCVLTPDGREWCFGYYASYGGGHDIAQEAIGAVFRAEDGRGAPTALTSLVLGALELPSAEMLMRAVIARRLDRARVLALCPLVFEAAEDGDRVAAEVIVRQGHALAEYGTAIIRRFGMEHLAFDVVLCGSVFKGKGPLLIDTATRDIQSVAPYARVVRAQYEPAVGGVLLAYDALDILVTDEMYANLARTQPPASFFSTAGSSS